MSGNRSNFVWAAVAKANSRTANTTMSARGAWNFLNTAKSSSGIDKIRSEFTKLNLLSAAKRKGRRAFFTLDEGIRFQKIDARSSGLWHAPLARDSRAGGPCHFTEPSRPDHH